MNNQEKAEATIAVGLILFGLLFIAAFIGTVYLLVTAKF